jgi:hypothetical protein
VELFTLVAVFRPAMHRPFGIALIAFHLMVWFLMDIKFAFQPMMLALVFVFSPFAPPSVSFARQVRQLPLFGDLAVILGNLDRRRRVGREWRRAQGPAG